MTAGIMQLACITTVLGHKSVLTCKIKTVPETILTMQKFLNVIKLLCLILGVIGVILFFAHEEAKSLFRSDCGVLRSICDRWSEAGYPSGTNLDMFLGGGNYFLVNTQTFLVGTQNFQAQFTLRNPKINWKGGQLFVTTNKVLILHTDRENRIVQWVSVWPGLDLVNLTREKSESLK